jgi:Flp pilus assembly protein TadB
VVVGLAASTECREPSTPDLLVRIGNQMALWGTVFLAAAIVLAVYVVTNVLYVSQLALLVAGVAVVVFGWIWYGLPIIGQSPADDQAKGTEPPGADPGEP